MRARVLGSVIRRRVSILLCCALSAAVLVGAADVAPAQDWNGATTIVLNDRSTSTFRADSPFDQVHQYRFFAPAGTRLRASVVAARGADLKPEIALKSATGTAIDLGRRLRHPLRGRKAVVLPFRLTESGWYTLEVTPLSGSGNYTFSTRGSVIGRRFRPVEDDGDYEFEVVGPSTLGLAKVIGARRTKPMITGIFDPDGVALPGLTLPARLVRSTRRAKINLEQTGTYRITYDPGLTTKRLQPGEVRVLVNVTPPRSRELFANPDGQARVTMGRIDYGDPHNGTAAAGFVGSDACRECHTAKYESVVNSFHNSKMRATYREGAAGYVVPPAVDALFRAAGGTNLKTAAPGVYDGFTPDLRLGYVEGDELPYKVTVGPETHDVMYVMGGNGPWKQRFVVEIGASHYITPVQYNEKVGKFAAYHPEHWGTDGLPTAKKNSWERRCAGCHSTGVLLTFDDVTEEYHTGYAQMNVGCESCHNGGEDHVASQDADDIFNPADLPQTVEGNQRADLVCGKCHHRGGGGTPTGAPSGTGYPWLEGTGLFPSGGTEADFALYYTTGTGQYIREKDNPTGFFGTPGNRGDDTWIVSNKHHQQYLDLKNGPHGPDTAWDGVCYSCHDPHAGNDRKHMIVTELKGITGIENDNNKLCLACHRSQFGGITVAQVQDITDTTAPDAVRDAVIEHMADNAAMPIDALDYDPAGTGVGRCSKCHMPKTSKSAVYVADAAGHNEGDIHSHAMEVIWPIVSELPYDGELALGEGDAYGITNSCSGCHPTGPNDAAADQIAEWASDPDADGTFHADAARNFQTGVANAERDGGIACAACHTTDGFLAVQVGGDIHDLTDGPGGAARTAFVAESIKLEKGITCKACHGKNSAGEFRDGDGALVGDGEVALRFPKAELCGRCHNNETVVFDDHVDHGEILRHPQREMNMGVDGAEIAGKTYLDSFHVTAGLTCVDCHYDPGAGGVHTFEPTVASCNKAFCHSGVTFDRNIGKDYDGIGGAQGIQTELAGALDVLKDTIIANSAGASATIEMPVDEHTFFIGGTADGDENDTSKLNDLVALDLALMRGMFNWYYVEFDASHGVHNTDYAMWLIIHSYEEINGAGSWPYDKPQ